MMAPWRVSTPVKGVAVGRAGMTPDFVVERRTGGGAGSWTWDWAVVRGRRDRRGRSWESILDSDGARILERMGNEEISLSGV